jgi:hypothetical protein
MISKNTEFQRAQEELRDLTERLKKLKPSHSGGSKRLTKAGVRKMIARLREEIAIFEASSK